MKKSLARKLLNAPYIVWAAIFIVVPMMLVLYYALTDSNGNFTFANISELARYAPTFLRSLLYALIATFICLLLAYPISYIISQASAKAQKTLIMLVMLPMWMSFLIRTYSWITILANKGIINNFLANFGIGPLHLINTPGAVILGMVYNYLPYMILPIYSIMSRLDTSLIEAAGDLGANRFSVLKRVIFPLSLPGVISGVTMVFVPSVSTFYISQKLGGGKYLLVGDAIEMQFQQAYNYNLGAAISLVLMVLILISMAVMNRFVDDDGGVLI